MTLIQSVVGMDTFAIVASDTRVVEMIYVYDEDTLELKESFTVDSFEIDDKAFLITDNVIFALAGFKRHGETISESLQNLLKPDYYLDDCREIFIDVCTKYRDGFEAVDKDDRFCVTLTGFKKDGTAGVYSFTSYAGFRESIPLGLHYPLYVEFDGPTKDLNLKARVLWDLDTVKNMGDPVTTFTYHLAKVQGIVNRVEPKFVSPQCVYHILTKDEHGKIKYDKKIVDISPIVDIMPSKEDILKVL